MGHKNTCMYIFINIRFYDGFHIDKKDFSFQVTCVMFMFDGATKKYLVYSVKWLVLRRAYKSKNQAKADIGLSNPLAP